MLNPYPSLEQQPWAGFPLVGSRLLWKRIFYNPISAHSFFYPKKKRMLIVLSQEKPKGLAVGRGAPCKAPRGGGALERFFVSQACTKNSSLRHIQEKHFLSHACTKFLSQAYTKKIIVFVSKV